MALDAAFEFTPQQHTDDRGSFMEWFRNDRFTDVLGHRLALAQANCSVSASGVVRGIHYADVPPGQAKYVTCVRGAVFDVVVDLRVGSPTFGAWDGVTLEEGARRAVYVGEGLGHSFMALAEQSTVVYLCSTAYDPEREHAIHPLDPALSIDWPTAAPDGTTLTPKLSPKDAAAPTLRASRDADTLPRAETVASFLRELRARNGATTTRSARLGARDA